MKRFLSYIGSRRFAVYLLVLTTTVILLSNLLPNPSLMNALEVEKLKKERPLLYLLSVSLEIRSLTASPYFQVIPAFIFLSITICSLRRMRTELERSESGPERNREQEAGHIIVVRRGFTKDDLAGYISRKRWTIHESGDERTNIYARKGKGGVWGSLGFHAGMDIVLVGILISVITGIDGKIALTEGFPVSTPKDINWTKKANVGDFPLSELMLEKLDVVFEGGYPVKYNSRMKGVGRDGRLKSYIVGVNKPLNLNDYSVIFNKASFAPRFLLKKKDGELITDAVVNLLISMPGVVDSFDIPEKGLNIKAELFPDYYKENGEHKTRGRFPMNPVLFVEITKAGKMIGRGFIAKGQRVEFDGYSLEFTELRHWLELIISKDVGVPVIIIGFVAIILGLLVRFLLNDRHLWIIMKETDNGLLLEVGGRARFFPAMFDEELKKLAEEIRVRAEGYDKG